jgi:hypothetical protein
MRHGEADVNSAAFISGTRFSLRIYSGFRYTKRRLNVETAVAGIQQWQMACTFKAEGGFEPEELSDTSKIRIRGPTPESAEKGRLWMGNRYMRVEFLDYPNARRCVHTCFVKKENLQARIKNNFSRWRPI